MWEKDQDHQSKAGSQIPAVHISTSMTSSKADHQQTPRIVTQMPFFTNTPDDLLTMEWIITNTMQESSLLAWTMLLPFVDESWQPTDAWQMQFEDFSLDQLLARASPTTSIYLACYVEHSDLF